ncbi:hypothetical protein GOP47_0030933 [Adiantum capillus-veneris]|nr:hypothetical protein GOP47_0030933 [Adiantum capillus-veneris]
MDFNLQVYKLKITLSNTYYIRNRINEDAAKTLLGLSDDEQDLPLLTDWKRKEIQNMMAFNMRAIAETYEAISKAKDFMEKLSNQIESLRAYGVA